MTDLRSKLIRLAHQNPELRPHILPLLKTAGESVLDYVFDPDELDEAFKNIRGDDMTRDLLQEVLRELRAQLSVSPGVMTAISGVRSLTRRSLTGVPKDPALIRNIVFRAANALRVKTPSF